MANNRFAFEALEEFRAALRNLPEHLADEAGGIVQAAAGEAGAEIIERYPKGPAIESKSLKAGVVVSRMEMGRFGAGYIVKSTAPHAYIFENGTQARHTELGYNRGAMPPGHVFIPIAIRKRRAMSEQLVGLLRREGFEVTGDGG